MGDVLDFLPNYTGPYISNGKIQSSVEFGERSPKDELDALSRLHDSAYAKYNDRLHRSAADAIYNDQTKALGKKYPGIVGDLVLYGNQTEKSFANLASKAGYGPLGLLYGGLENMYDLSQYLTKGSAAKREILDYFKTDPHSEFQVGGGSKMNGDTPTIVYNGDTDTVDPFVETGGIDEMNPKRLRGRFGGDTGEQQVGLTHETGFDDIGAMDGTRIGGLSLMQRLLPRRRRRRRQLVYCGNC